MSSLYSSVGIRFQQILIDLHTKEVTTHFKSNSLLEKKKKIQYATTHLEDIKKNQ